MGLMPMSDIDVRAFLGRRVAVDSELILAYADKRGCDVLEVAELFHARLTQDKGNCKMEWVPKVLGWKCSNCGRITRGHRDARMNYCPNCGAANEG